MALLSLLPVLCCFGEGLELLLEEFSSGMPPLRLDPLPLPLTSSPTTATATGLAILWPETPNCSPLTTLSFALSPSCCLQCLDSWLSPLGLLGVSIPTSVAEEAFCCCCFFFLPLAVLALGCCCAIPLVVWGLALDGGITGQPPSGHKLLRCEDSHVSMHSR